MVPKILYSLDGPPDYTRRKNVSPFRVIFYSVHPEAFYLPSPISVSTDELHYTQTKCSHALSIYPFETYYVKDCMMLDYRKKKRMS
jgi:hypothetical protein